jgi:ankyrin repeat protein
MAKLKAAIRRQDIDAIKAIIKNAPKLLNEKMPGTGRTMLMFAAEAGCLEVFEYLIEAGADINAHDDNFTTVLLCACESCFYQIWHTHAKESLQIVESLVKHGVSVDEREAVAIIRCAAKHGSLELVKISVDFAKKLGIIDDCFGTRFIDTKDYWNYTPLLFAACFGHHDIVKFLVEAGADTSVVNRNDGFCALRSAIKHCHKKVVQVLLRHVIGTASESINTINDDLLGIISDYVALQKPRGPSYFLTQ